MKNNTTVIRNSYLRTKQFQMYKKGFATFAEYCKSVSTPVRKHISKSGIEYYIYIINGIICGYNIEAGKVISISISVDKTEAKLYLN